MKKIFVLTTVFSFLCSIDCFAANISNDITNRTWNGKYEVGVIPSKDDGKWKYPCVGASAGETYLYNKFEKQKLIDIDLYASIIDIAERERSYLT